MSISPDIQKRLGEAIINLRDRVHNEVDSAALLKEAVLSFGPACIFDEPKNDEQAKGMLIVIDWLRTFI
jgi:hypothetical protein